jgi:hypothetical protein
MDNDERSLDLDCFIMPEAERRQPPTKKDIRELQAVLKDFNIPVKVPAFNTYADLDRFRHNAIKTKLA